MTTIRPPAWLSACPTARWATEVGHTNMGAGRIVYQQLTLITKSIQDGEMFKNPVLVKNMKAAIEAGKAIHLMGLVGTGGVHSHADHWFGVLEMAKHMGAKTSTCTASSMAVITDLHSGKDFVKELMAKMEEMGVGKIATVIGPLLCDGPRQQLGARRKGLQRLFAAKATTLPTLPRYRNPMKTKSRTSSSSRASPRGGRVQDGDSVMFFNFRPDRAREITRIFVDADFTGLSAARMASSRSPTSA